MGGDLVTSVVRAGRNARASVCRSRGSVHTLIITPGSVPRQKGVVHCYDAHIGNRIVRSRRVTVAIELAV